ncbi:hypothetical protein [Bartonella senegalensis]|uniref:hypothetical protein n=1 Tax=Bartonella senegalensis TaxID=1468418 RepID=UPI0002DF3C55|nr:hypothetical protein [Bartonella senegalensis]
MQKNGPYQSKKQLFLAVPQTCYQTSPLFSLANITVCFYRIQPTYQCDRILQRKPILYAPSFFALWALYFAGQNPTLFSSILCHGRQWTSPFALLWLRLCLQNERLLLGSDVPSPMIMKALHHHVAMSNYSALPIGTWLQLVKNYKKNCKNLSTPFFWFDHDNINLHQIIPKLQDEI